MRKVLILCGSLLILGTACGDDVPPEPEMTGLQFACSDTGAGMHLDSLVVTVTDPNRDLVSVRGTINGAQITLTDEDADQQFTWSPPDGAAPVACSGEFVVSLTAHDKAGNQTTLYKVVEQ